MASWLDNLSSGLKNIGNSIYNTVYENKDTIGDALSFAGRSLSPEVYGQWKQAQSRQRELLLQGTIKAIEDGSLAPEKGNAVLKKLGVELPDGFTMGPGVPAQKYQAEQAAALKLEEDLKGAETEAFDATASWYKQKNPTAVVGDKGEVVTTAPERMTRFPEYWENIAASLEARGRRKEAQEALDRAVKLRSALKPDLEEVSVGKDEKGESVFRKRYFDRDKMQWVDVGEPYKKGPVAQVNVDARDKTESQYGKTFGEKVSADDFELRKAASKAPSTADSANRVLEILNSGKVITGAGANFRLAFSKAAALLGYDDPAIANTEELVSGLAQQTLGMVKASGLGAGNGFSNTDRDFVEKAAGGKISYDSESLRRLATIAHRVAFRSADDWNKRVRSMPRSAIEGTGIDTAPIAVPPIHKNKVEKTLEKYGDKK